MRVGGLGCSIVVVLFAFFSSCSRIDRAKAPRESRNRIEEKIAELIANGGKARLPAKSTSFSERELNTALKSHFKEMLPKGVTEPQITLLGNSRVAAQAIIDVDELKRKRSKHNGTPTLNLFGGKIPLLLRGDFIARNGRGQFKLESAEVNGIPLPNTLVRDLLVAYTRSRHRPAGFDLEEPFLLPVNIRAVIVNPGEAIVVQ